MINAHDASMMTIAKTLQRDTAKLAALVQAWSEYEATVDEEILLAINACQHHASLDASAFRKRANDLCIGWVVSIAESIDFMYARMLESDFKIQRSTHGLIIEW